MSRASSDEPSAFEAVLQGAASPEERTALLKVLHLWANGDPHGFPAQLALLCRAQWRAAASVPVEISAMLDRYREVTAAAVAEIRAVATEKIGELRGVEQTAAMLEAIVLRLDSAGDATMARLEAAAQAHEAATQRAQAANRRNDLLVLGTAFCFVAALGLLAGALLMRWRLVG